MFSGWIYDHLKPHAAELKVAHPLMLRGYCGCEKQRTLIRWQRLLNREHPTGTERTSLT